MMKKRTNERTVTQLLSVRNYNIKKTKCKVKATK